jgi:16S rRNA (guanine(966)-N(2))-methyltransferase RsmD
MRVTGGVYRSRIVKCPKGIIRPSMDRMRESLFAILGDLGGSSFLDLFSGSGIIGIEAASRGAEPVVCVERDAGKRPVILENLSMVKSSITLRIMNVERFIKGCSQHYDYIFLDPPFAMKGKEELVAAAGGLLAPDGTLMIHHPKEEILPERIGGLYRADRRVYGGSILCFYRLESRDSRETGTDAGGTDVFTDRRNRPNEPSGREGTFLQSVPPNPWRNPQMPHRVG